MCVFDIFRKKDGVERNEMKYFAAAQNFMLEQAPKRRGLCLVLM